MGTLLQQLWRLPFYGCSMGDVVRLPEVGKSLVCCVTAVTAVMQCEAAFPPICKRLLHWQETAVGTVAHC